MRNPETRITRISTGARTMLGSPSKKMPLPKRYRCPCNSIISPMYMISVIPADTIAGIQSKTAFFILSSSEPEKIPAVSPIRMKNADIKIADNAETLMLPSRQNAVKQARIHSPRNATVETDCIISARFWLRSPVRIIYAKP